MNLPQEMRRSAVLCHLVTGARIAVEKNVANARQAQRFVADHGPLAASKPRLVDA